MTETSAVRPIPLWLALLPLLFLIAMLASSVVLFGDNASYGPNQIALMVGAGVAGVIGLFLGFSVKDIEEAMVQGILLALKACLILLAVGCVALSFAVITGFSDQHHIKKAGISPLRIGEDNVKCKQSITFHFFFAPSLSRSNSTPVRFDQRLRYFLLSF